MLERLKDLREEKGLTQKEVAGYLKINQRTYSNYEIGKRELPLHHMVRLASLYGTSTDYLLGLTDESRPYPSRRK